MLYWQCMFSVFYANNSTLSFFKKKQRSSEHSQRLLKSFYLFENLRFQPRSSSIFARNHQIFLIWGQKLEFTNWNSRQRSKVRVHELKFEAVNREDCILHLSGAQVILQNTHTKYKFNVPDSSDTRSLCSKGNWFEPRLCYPAVPMISFLGS
jgi:hypothetical protein